MKNVRFAVEGDELVIRCNLKEAGELSASKKSLVIASTKGNTKVEGTPFTCGLNLYTSAK